MRQAVDPDRVIRYSCIRAAFVDGFGPLSELGSGFVTLPIDVSSEGDELQGIDLRPSMPPVRDQGARGTCVAFAVTAAHESAGGTKARQRDLAEEVLYWGCKQIDGDTVPGTSFASSAAALSQWGQPDEDRWPYDPLRDDQTAAYRPPPGILDPALCRRASMRPIEATSAAIKHWLRRGYLVILALWITEGFLDAAEGVIRAPRDDEPRLDGHAVVVVGYADQGRDSEGALKVRNSWGQRWGAGGYGYLPDSYLNLGSEAWIVESADE